MRTASAMHCASWWTSKSIVFKVYTAFAYPFVKMFSKKN